jgi:hypothetical protein
MMPTRCAAFFVAASVALCAPLARAAGPSGASAATAHPAPTAAQLQTARDLFASATKDEDAQRWADALEKLHKVAEVKLTAGVRYHTAFCEEKLGLSATALTHYTEAFDAAGREKNRDVQELLKPPFLSDLRARVPTLTVEVPPDAVGAEVTVDGHLHPQNLWSVAVPLDPGVHRIEARAPDRVPFLREMALHEREVTVLDISLPRLANTPPPPPPAPLPVASAPPAPAPTPRQGDDTGRTTTAFPATAPSSSASHRPTGAALGTTIGAVLLAGGGVGAFVLAGSAQSSGESQCLTRTTSCNDLKTPVRVWDSVALGAWIGAAALATTAIVLWATPATAESGGGVRVTTSGSQVRVEGSF